MKSAVEPLGKAGSKRVNILIILSVIGIVLGILLTQHYYELRNGASSGFKSYCNLSEKVNCDAIAASPYAELIPGFPLSSFVVGWFLGLLGIAFFARNPYWRRESLRAAFLVTAVGSALSLIYFAIMIGVLKTYCVLCIGVDLVSIASLCIVLSLKPEGIRVHKPDLVKWKTFVGLVIISVAIAVFGLKAFDSTAVSTSDLTEMASTILASDPISVNTSDIFPSFGPKDAPITIVEFSDFQCPYCRIGALTLNTVFNRYRGKIHVIFRNFPLDPSCNRMVEHTGHAYACEAAKVAVCSHLQGKFEPVYQTIFEHQSSLGVGKASQWAATAGVDPNALGICLGSTHALNGVAKDIEEGIQVGVKATPTFFINGHRAEGPQPLPVWIKVIDRLLSDLKK